jgi:class 3 adenylate cyclase
MKRRRFVAASTRRKPHLVSMGDVGGRVGSSASPAVDAAQELPAPSGSLSIVFTDIEDSTALWETVPSAMRVSLQMHDDLLRAKLKRHQGYEVKVIGDGFMVAFRTATQALAWCMEIQNDLLSAPWPQELLGTPWAKTLSDKQGKVVFRGLRVRMCIHWGAPIASMSDITNRMDYIGPVVHRAARSIQKAKGGQIVVTREFLVEARKMLQPVGTPGTDKADDVGGISTSQGLRFRPCDEPRELTLAPPRSITKFSSNPRRAGLRRSRSRRSPTQGVGQAAETLSYCAWFTSRTSGALPNHIWPIHLWSAEMDGLGVGISLITSLRYGCVENVEPGLRSWCVDVVSQKSLCLLRLSNSDAPSILTHKNSTRNPRNANRETAQCSTYDLANIFYLLLSLNHNRSLHG